jgi:cytochrome c553
MKKYTVLLIIAILVFACTAEQDTNEAMATNGMKMTKPSELALLMKEIHANAKNWRADLLDGKLPADSTDVYNRLVSSTPTNPNVTGPVFEGFSMNYQGALDGFLEANNIDLAREAYNNLVTACIQCHQSYCTGPIPTIKKLYVKAL